MAQFLQEIVFHTNKSRHTIHIVAQISVLGGKPDYFLAEVVSLTPWLSPYAIKIHGLPDRYADATKAFEVAFDGLRSCIKNIAETITAIDNPCNCPFVSQASEQALITAAGVTVAVKVNGQ